MFLFICYEGLGTVSLNLWCSFGEIFRSHFTSQQITDKTKSVGYKHLLKTSDLTGDA